MRWFEKATAKNVDAETAGGLQINFTDWCATVEIDHVGVNPPSPLVSWRHVISDPVAGTTGNGQQGTYVRYISRLMNRSAFSDHILNSVLIHEIRRTGNELSSMPKVSSIASMRSQ